MSDCAPFLDVVLNGAQRLVCQSLQPEDPRLEVVRRHAHVEAQSNSLRSWPELGKARKRAVDMPARAGLIAEVVQRSAEDAIAHDQLDRIDGIGSQIGEAPGVFERGTKLPVVELIDA